jgi:hypothetical protein
MPLIRRAPGASVCAYDGSGTSWSQIGGTASSIYVGGYGLVVTNPSTDDRSRYSSLPVNVNKSADPVSTSPFALHDCGSAIGEREAGHLDLAQRTRGSRQRGES